MFTPGQKVLVLGVPFDFKRVDRMGVLVSKIPYEPHYYRVKIDGVVHVVNDSMLALA